MKLTYFTVPAFKKKQIVTAEGEKGLPAVAGHEDQPFVDLVIFCSKFPFVLGAILLFGLVPSVQAQFTYTTNNGTITITGYTGSGGMVTIPGMIDDLRVTDIGTNAFQGSALTSVVIPDSVTNIGASAFASFLGPLSGLYGPVFCPLTSVTIPNGVTTIGDSAFWGCKFLTNVNIGDSVTSIGASAFSGWLPSKNPFAGLPPLGVCTLTSITIPGSVTNIGPGAFAGCGLTNAYFLGNAPDADSTVFSEDPLSAYYLPGTTGWADFTTNTGVPTALWTLPYPLVLNGSSGVLNNQFGFTISWATNVPVVVEASTDLSKRVWTPIATNTLTGGASHFSDPQWTNYPARFYRLSQ